MRIRSETMPDDDPNDTPRTPLHKVVEALPRPINISFDRVELPVSPLLSPNSLLSPRRRLSVTYVRRSRFAATRTEVSIDMGPIQLFMLLCFLATCSAFGVAVPGFGFFHRPAGATGGIRLGQTAGGFARSAIAASSSSLASIAPQSIATPLFYGDSSAMSSAPLEPGRSSAQPSLQPLASLRRMLETLQCAATASTAAEGIVALSIPSQRPALPRMGKDRRRVASSVSFASTSMASSAIAAAGGRWRADLLSGLLSTEHKLRAELSGGSGVLAACACLSGAISEAACAWLFPGAFGRLRLAYGGGRRVWAESALASAEEKLGEALRSSPNVEAALGNVTIQSRVKTLRSVFEKRVLRGMESVDDLLALRVIVEPQDAHGEETTVEEEEETCLKRVREVEALLRALWPGAVESTKDYVSSPKPNGYRSVHVMLRLPSSGGRLEVQIRTRRMHDHAERGDAAHAHYKAAALSGSGSLAAL